MELLNSPLFGVCLTIIAYIIGLEIYKKFKLPILNPILIALIIIIPILLYFKIPLETYEKGGDLISFFLAPATVVLAVPLYKKIDLLKQHFIPILGGVIAGILTSILFCTLIGKALGLDLSIIKSSLSKSLTTPIAIELSKQVGGIVPITIVMVMITGITGAVMAPFICKIFKIENKVAKGIAIGTASHAVGTSRAIEMGETQGAMSGLAIGVAGILTVFILPLLHIILF
ncbi:MULTISPECIES: LrgB family protein [Psychrilyobacter]|uniref:LrgB family protein n=1 Tax=Psychrilyobacter piezotolerans TaxID=2293438 RepID=A0ABX9KEE8_9FUSO|nr:MULTISPECIES: LrgB family protein [Psychrilyobacter]MCS5421963.1 LrgB family protein [Psychrilyobacter sp. S5]NDI78842.1 LrgB family protein [Psychrilyobacter piezotolerans]RDE59442.1 LrgB family protein [Psychrilyobacter sp. S5]REI39912.1 LrgB family protein [Psychrilyobacter piezotolerans]